MNPAELRGVASQGFDIQLHTHRHRMPRERDLFVKEIEDNRRALELGGKDDGRFRHFCYPSGVYYPQTAEWLRQCGILSAATCDPGIAAQSSNPYYLPRFSDSMNIHGIVFEAWVSGVRGLPRRRRGYARLIKLAGAPRRLAVPFTTTLRDSPWPPHKPGRPVRHHHAIDADDGPSPTGDALKNKRVLAYPGAPANSHWLDLIEARRQVGNPLGRVPGGRPNP